MANSDQTIETPDWFVREVERFLDVTFIFDLACSQENKKAKIGITESINTLTLDWSLTFPDWCWLNHPFRYTTEYINKCHKESIKGSNIVMILPLSTDSNTLPIWDHAKVYLINGRLWKEVRSVMLAVWTLDQSTKVPELITLDGANKKLTLRKVSV